MTNLWNIDLLITVLKLEAVQAKDRTVPVNMALANLYREEGMDRSAVTCYKEVLRSVQGSIVIVFDISNNLMIQV